MFIAGKLFSQWVTTLMLASLFVDYLVCESNKGSILTSQKGWIFWNPVNKNVFFEYFVSHFTTTGKQEVGSVPSKMPLIPGMCPHQFTHTVPCAIFVWHCCQVQAIYWFSLLFFLHLPFVILNLEKTFLHSFKKKNLCTLRVSTKPLLFTN